MTQVLRVYGLSEDALRHRLAELCSAPGVEVTLSVSGRHATVALTAPAEELETRLSRYQNALVGSEGMLVYYFVLDQKDTKKAFTALTGRQQ